MSISDKAGRFAPVDRLSAMIVSEMIYKLNVLIETLNSTQRIRMIQILQTVCFLFICTACSPQGRVNH